MKNIDSAQQETPIQSEENNQFIQHPDDTLDRNDRDALFASRDAGDPQERDRRVWPSMIFTASTGIAMIVAATFATVLEYSGFWQNLWFAICIGFTFLFFVGLFRFGSALSSQSSSTAGLRPLRYRPASLHPYPCAPTSPKRFGRKIIAWMR